MKVITQVLAISLIMVGSASSNDLIVTVEKAASGQGVALDFSSDGTASALQMRFKVGDAKKANVDLSKCVAGLPKSHSGECRFDKGVLTVLVYSDTNATLPNGVVSIGTISFPRAGGALVLTELLAFDSSAKQIQIASQGNAEISRTSAK